MNRKSFVPTSKKDATKRLALIFPSWKYGAVDVFGNRDFFSHQARRGKAWGLWSLALASFGYALFFGLPLFSQPRTNCKADVKKLCASVKPGQGRIKACLESQEANLSEGCRRQLQLWKAVQTACSADREKYCGGKSGPVLKQCIKANRRNFSKACLDAVKAARAK